MKRYFKMYRPMAHSRFVHIDVFGFHGNCQQALDWLSTIDAKFDFVFRSVRSIGSVVHIVLEM